MVKVKMVFEIQYSSPDCLKQARILKETLEFLGEATQLIRLEKTDPGFIQVILRGSGPAHRLSREGLKDLLRDFSKDLLKNLK